MDPDTLIATRSALHAVAEWVLAPARHTHDGRIGLRATPGGFGNDRARVDGVDLVVGDRRQPLATLGAAAAFAGVEPGRDTGTYAPETKWDADASLFVDPEAARLLADWFALGTSLLEQLRAETDTPSGITLWPEHFDVAIDAGPEGHRVNYGASPGDDDHVWPYLYVGPWSAVERAEPFWNESFGASLGYDDALDHERALAFLRRGRQLTD